MINNFINPYGTRTKFDFNWTFHESNDKSVVELFTLYDLILISQMFTSDAFELIQKHSIRAIAGLHTFVCSALIELSVVSTIEKLCN